MLLTAQAAVAAAGVQMDRKPDEACQQAPWLRVKKAHQLLAQKLSSGPESWWEPVAAYMRNYDAPPAGLLS